ncbi:MAG: radical SAM protein [bacterium]|nr:radical SAM protein [bacterium]
MNELEALAAEAREISQLHFGKNITFYVPGMFNYEGRRGSYAAISLTGGDCALGCDHCQGKLLEPMFAAKTPDELINVCGKLKDRGNIGCLISGGLGEDGSIPWGEFAPAIKHVKETTGLFISVHCGFLDVPTALRLKGAGVDQALVDVVGNGNTIAKVYRTDIRVEDIMATLSALKSAGIPTVPHVVVGLDYGKIKGEYRALEIIKEFAPAVVVIVSFMPLPGTPMENVPPPPAAEVARVMMAARLDMPRTPIALGCARRRGDSEIDVWGVNSGINRIAIPSEKAVRRAKELGLRISWQETCCSLSLL